MFGAQCQQEKSNASAWASLGLSQWWPRKDNKSHRKEGLLDTHFIVH